MSVSFWIVNVLVVGFNMVRVPMLRIRLSLIALWIVGLQPAVTLAAPGDAVVPGSLRADATFQHIGVVWEVTGDNNRNSALTLEFRKQGESAWKPGAPAMRAFPTTIVNGAPLNLNRWGASALFLQPGTAYELRLTLTDPDGGGTVQSINAMTRIEPQASPTARQRYVVPGTGGGTGTVGDPFKGLPAAANAAQAGDVFNVAAGTYAPFQLLASGAPGNPIVFRGPISGVALIDGGGTDRGLVTLGEFNLPVGWVIVEGFTLQNGHWGVDAQRTHNIVIRRNVIQNVDDGIVNRRGNGDEFGQTIGDNIITGRTPWPQSNGNIPSERGIDLKGYGNVVAHNRLRYFGDCVSVQPSTSASYGNDVFGNDASYCVDDGIEIDYNQANVRVWRNRVMNSRMGVSVQPIAGGPAYILRNEFFNLEGNPIKMNNQPSGYFVLHNTSAMVGNGQGDGSVWRNAVFRNNVFLGTRYAFEFTTVRDEGFRDFDYNAWFTDHSSGGASDPDFKWENVRYSRLSNLQAIGVEVHGMYAAFSHLVNAALPANPYVDVPPGNRDLRLAGGAPEINAGQTLANVNDGFVTDGLPDMGAFEAGTPPPVYGPRPLAADLSTSTKSVSRGAAPTGTQVTYTVVLRSTGAPITSTVLFTDAIPSGLSYVNGTLTASSGTPDASNPSLLRWSGDMSAAATVTITFNTTVTASGVQLITNSAQIGSASTGELTRSVSLIANGLSLYLPLVYR
jgi:uncharacterized repeat protein (TIGR01451 family)